MKRIPVIARLGLGILLGSGVGLALARHTTTSSVNAEERGLRVPLSYIHGFSNWGPTNVQGMAVVWPIEGVAELDIHFLPRLSHGESYAWWVMNSTTGDALRLSSFNTDDAGDAHVDTYLMGTLPRQANMVLIAVNHPGDPTNQPSPQRSLSGYMITPAEQPAPNRAGGATGAATDPTGKGTQHERDSAPFRVIELPQTGGGPDARGK